ncbi:Rieske (2Fe-2S) protein [Streptomyces roseoverticillatus]|uniref:Rieske (2Fe-2S) protein n=1 Tax=Streptomyces roseoverticillatus TaxID=66429 RepID=UPI001F405C42|nr:Rieske (2Fe-2S) protein [Streptomyces roseoverticillatus]MCF3101612.1 Rieske (2Fe-2S) protein [Streptomyces roseoverticillatus]
MNHVSRAASTASPAPRAPHGSTRRGVVAAAGAAGLVTLLAACGGGDDDGRSGEAKDGGKGEGKGGSKDGGKDESKDGELAKAADIPEGGGKVFPDRKVVVTQPAKGEFKAFSAVCTHQGCLVKEVSGGTINCPCHGSKFGIADGSVKGGPAQRPLAEEQVSVHGGSLHLG